jgi:hypothetical protein
VQAGTALPGTKWITLGVRTIPVIRAGFPQIVHFDLPSTVLPMPASLTGNSHWCSVVFVHAAQDPFTSTIAHVDALTLADRKVGQKNLHIVQFVGTPPPPGTGIGTWAMLLVSGVHFRERGLINLVIDARGFDGDLHLVPAPPLRPRRQQQIRNLREGSAAVVKRWSDGYAEDAKRLFYEGKYPDAQYKLLVESMRLVSRQTPLVAKGGSIAELRELPISPKDEIPVFLRIDPTPNARVGSVFEFDIQQFDTKSKQLLGGSRYRVEIARKAR